MQFVLLFKIMNSKMIQLLTDPRLYNLSSSLYMF